MTETPGLKLIPDFYAKQKSSRLYRRLLEEQQWPDNRYVVAGRQFTLPRRQTWHADPGIRYRYSNNLLPTLPWTPLLRAIRAEVEQHLAYAFNAVLVNWYRNGEDYVGWHADDEPELRDQTWLASVSLGAERLFAYRRKTGGSASALRLPAGSLLIMDADFQRHWLHSVPQDPGLNDGRINLTFRRVSQPESAASPRGDHPKAIAAWSGV